jgi:hypothetical protein
MMSSAGIKYDTRLSIGIGSVDFVAENRISDFRGLAFTLSGREAGWYETRTSRF